MQYQTFSRLAFGVTLASWVAISCAPAESDSNNDGGGGATAAASVGSTSGSGVATSSGSASGSASGSTSSSGVATSSGTTAAGTGGDSSGGSGGAEPTGSGGAGTGGWPEGAIPMGNAPVKSAGCGKATTLTSKEYTISSSGQNRVYYVDMPKNYDMNKPYRLFYTSHWIGSRYQDVKGQDFYFLKPQLEADGEQAIFVAPSSDGATWQEKDHALFDDIMELMNESVCYDTTRVFATGFSFGGMITYSLSTNHQAEIRAAVGIAPANYNIWLPQKTRKPIAWMHTTGMSDGTCPWVNNEGQKRGAKFIALEKAEDNGCTIPNDIPTSNGKYSCFDFQDCDPEHPTRVCTFGGGHTNIDGNPNWIPIESWKFFKQF
ncbi:alpha/beta hydrolase family esterase [Sorangium sp. So ce117]|uniref:alpha/beta hydrolase family esterase n=1 Tax=Sorangium sp. So ce117 TaxID=3133277 RepID=UPI003F6403C0